MTALNSSAPAVGLLKTTACLSSTPHFRRIDWQLSCCGVCFDDGCSHNHSVNDLRTSSQRHAFRLQSEKTTSYNSISWIYLVRLHLPTNSIVQRFLRHLQNRISRKTSIICILSDKAIVKRQNVIVNINRFHTGV